MAERNFTSGWIKVIFPSSPFFLSFFLVIFAEAGSAYTFLLPMIDTLDGSIRRIPDTDIGGNEESCFSSGILAGKYDEKCR